MLPLWLLSAAFVGSTTAAAQTVLHGAGATFPAPVYGKWFDGYQKRNPGLQLTYEAVGSEAGIQLLGEGKVDFAGSDKPLSDEDLSQLGLRVTHIATVIGGVVPIYNVSGLRTDLHFSGEILAGIYLGKIKKWNDPAIRAANRGAALPDAEIVVVRRSDGSGGTFVWTDYLSKVSPEWKARAGSDLTVNWPVGAGAEGNEGVADTVQKTSNAIGYVELIYAIQHKLSIGAVRNAAGLFVQASLASVTAAAEDLRFEKSGDFRISLTNAPGKQAYPIASFTWLLVPQETGDPGKRAALLGMLRWVLTSGQKQCSALGYAPLPAAVAESELRALDSMH
jgi:phosphate transport system substrate-binding protein